MFSSAQYPGGEKYEPSAPLHKGENSIEFVSTPLKIKEGFVHNPEALQVGEANKIFKHLFLLNMGL